MKFLKALLLSLLMLSANNAFAVTEFLVEVKDSGGDYTTIFLAESALDENITAATTKVFSFDANTGTIPDGTSVSTDGGNTTGVCIHQSINGQILIKDISGGTFDDNDVVTDGTNSVTLSDSGDAAQIRAVFYNTQNCGAQCNFEGGTYDTTYKTIFEGDTSGWDGTCSGAVNINVTNYSFSWFSFRNNNLEGRNFCVKADGNPGVAFNLYNATGVVLKNIIIENASLYTMYVNVTGSNILILNSKQDGFFAKTDNYRTQYFYGITILNSTRYGIYDEHNGYNSSRGVNLYNAVIAGSGTADIYAVDGTLVTCDYVATSDGTATDCGYNSTASPQTGITSSDLSYTTGFLASGSSLIDAGYDYSGTTGISTDIIGTTRPQGSAWDIGAFEYTTWRPQIIGIY